jgi:sensor histidine kinase YesM
MGYALFRFWLYYVTVQYYPTIFLEYMLLSEILFAATAYLSIGLYKRLFDNKKYLLYFLLGIACWLLYLYVRTVFQNFYLKAAPNYRINTFSNVLITNITFVIPCFLFITACKYFKDGFIRQQFDAQKKQQQLVAEVNNLKSQIAPHFLFNTLNNLYGLAVDKSDKLPDLMLRLSDLLRHSLYETQKPLLSINDEMNVLKSYIKLETIRLEDNLQLDVDNKVPANSPFKIAPLILIVFIENAFKHSKLVQSSAVKISIHTALENEWFRLTIKNNYNKEKERSSVGIGLKNVRRRLELLYPDGQHLLTAMEDEGFYSVILQLKLIKET